MKGWQHFKTITHHKWLVLQGCFRVGLYWQGLTHDLSKYHPTEFMVGAKYYQGTRSPNSEERSRFGFSKAWIHHKGRNRHHFEYWTDYNPETKRIEPVKMPVKFVKEMYCDRVAAGKVYLGKKYTDENPIGYFLRGSARMNMHPETAELLGKWLMMLKDEGEKAVFRDMKKTKDY